MDESLKETTTLHFLFETARSEGTFGESLNGLSFEKLIDLKNLMDERHHQEEPSLTLARVRIRINRFCGVKIFSLKDVEKWHEIYKKLYEELRELGDKIEAKRREREIEYFKSFFDYLNTLNPKERGHNLSEWHLARYVSSDEKQRTPDEDMDGKAVISYNETFESNLKFLHQHIAKAMIIHNMGGK